jgi:PA14 domain/Bacterial TSP3 repeat
MILSHSWSVCRSLVQRVAPVLAVVLSSSLALKAQNLVGTQWSWVNVNFDDTTRSGLSGPAGGLGMTWNQCLSTAELTKTGLLDSNGVATAVGFTCDANMAFSWTNPGLGMLTGSVFMFNRNTPFNTVINGLTPGKKYTLYLASYVPNETGSRNVYTLSNVSTSGSTQLVDNGGPNGKSDRWLRGVNYTRFENIIPDQTNSIRLSLVSGTGGERAHLSGFQLIENPAAATSPYAVWLAGFNFSGIPGADLALDGDPDRDLYNNMEEFQLGLNPTLANRRAGAFMTETWSGISGTTVAKLFAAPSFFKEPDTVSLKMHSALRFGNSYSCTRSRAYLTPAVTGNYTIWLCARTSAELYFSTDFNGVKYAKKRIAVLSSDLGHGAGIDLNEPNLWDRFASQQSTKLSLQAGQTYYVEIDHHGGGYEGSHTSLAWARDGGAREVIPDSLFSSYTKTPDDLDDDYLPDSWESQKGLNPTDNGYSDPQRQGERGDYDGDGLSNREEYLLGSNPTNSDTDGDGQSDGSEVNALGTNALIFNAITDTFMSSVGLASYVNSSTGWTMTSGGLLANSFRGEATWNFTVPSTGFWLFRLNTELMGSTFGNEEVPVVLKVDGKIVTRTKIRYGSAKLGLLQALTPWLTAGNHQVSVFVDNMFARRTVRLVSLKLYKPADPTTSLIRDNLIFSHPATSRTSPAYLEGHARDVSSMTVNGLAVSEGSGSGHWFTNVVLADQATPQIHNIHFENGMDTTGTYTWQATNVMDAEIITIRQGDTLRLGAWGTNLNLTSNLNFSNGGSVTLSGSATLLRTFTGAGTETVTATLSSGVTATLSVKIIGSPVFPTPMLDVLDGGNRALFIEPIVPEITFEMPADKGRMLVTRSAVTTTITIMPSGPESFGILARLFAGGPILSVQRVNVIGVSNASQNDLTSVATSSLVGYKICITPLTVVNLPPGGRIDVTIFRAGVMFANGNTFKTIYASDISNGRVNLEFFVLFGLSGGYCHTLSVYDRNGALLTGN